jgi:hypothetical protein
MNLGTVCRWRNQDRIPETLIGTELLYFWTCVWDGGAAVWHLFFRSARILATDLWKSITQICVNLWPGFKGLFIVSAL